MTQSTRIEPGERSESSAEIEACRPFFIGILGERYGYVPDGPLPPDLVEQEPWLAKSAGASVTAHAAHPEHPRRPAVQ